MKKFRKPIAAWLTWGYPIAKQKEELADFVYWERRECKIVNYFNNRPGTLNNKKALIEHLENFDYMGVCTYFEDDELKALCNKKGLVYCCVTEKPVPENLNTPERLDYLRRRRELFAAKYDKKIITDDEIKAWQDCVRRGLTIYAIAKHFKRNWVTVHRHLKHGDPIN